MLRKNLNQYGVPYGPNYIPGNEFAGVSSDFYKPFIDTFNLSLDQIDLDTLLNAIYYWLLYNHGRFFSYYRGAQIDCIYVRGNWIDIETTLTTPWFDIAPKNEPVVMLVGKYPGVMESMTGLAFTGEIAKKFIEQINFSQCRFFYCTNICRGYYQLTNDSYKWSMGKSTLHVLFNEISLIRPDYIVYTPLGSFNRSIEKFLKFTPILFNGSIGKIPAVYRKNGTLTFEQTDELVYPEKEVRILPLPFKFNKDIESAARIFFQAKDSKNDFTYEVITTISRLREVIDELSGAEYVAIDSEWYGRSPIDSKAFLRCIQFAASKDKAYIVQISNEKGERTFDDVESAMQALEDFLLKKKIVGTFLYTDVIWLKAHGLDLTKKYLNAPEEIVDLAFVIRAVDEDAKLGLCEIVRRYADIPRWDLEIEKWCSLNDTESFGNAPSEILYPYAAADVCYLMLILKDALNELRCDVNQVNCERTAIISNKVSAAVSEMMECGVRLDIQKFHELKTDFEKRYEQILSELRQEINWPDFDPKKVQHRSELLFGDKYNAKKTRPEGAQTLDLDPIFATTNQSITWDLFDEDEQAILHPSTNKTVCGILSSKSELVRKLFYLIIINQALKTIFGTKSLLSYCSSDGRIRPFISPTLKTGRMSCSKPNLQNLSKRRDEDLSKILGKEVHIRDLLIPAPGKVLIMVDLIAAELYCAAIMARDMTLLDHCRRSALPKNDPDFYDIHSNLAVEAFRLNCKPTKEDLEKNGYAHLRTAAKTIIYGINYGRSIESVQLGINAEGVNVSREEVESLVAEFYRKYPNLEELRRRLFNHPLNHKWTRTYFGRVKRFNDYTTPAAINRIQRECANFHFQATVADAMSLCLYECWRHPAKKDIGYRILLCIHDELWVETPRQYKDETIEIIKECIDKIKIRPWNEFGQVISSDEFSFLSDCKIVDKGE